MYKQFTLRSKGDSNDPWPWGLASSMPDKTYFNPEQENIFLHNY